MGDKEKAHKEKLEERKKETTRLVRQPDAVHCML